jgi:hypothetical protein
VPCSSSAQEGQWEVPIVAQGERKKEQERSDEDKGERMRQGSRDAGRKRERSRRSAARTSPASKVASRTTSAELARAPEAVVSRVARCALRRAGPPASPAEVPPLNDPVESSRI